MLMSREARLTSLPALSVPTAKHLEHGDTLHNALVQNRGCCATCNNTLVRFTQPDRPLLAVPWIARARALSFVVEIAVTCIGSLCRLSVVVWVSVWA
jgi:hypothetical protein